MNQSEENFDPTTTAIAVGDDSSRIGEVRRTVNALAKTHGLPDEASGRAALVATELASNLLKHAREGEILVRAWDATIEIVSVDQGPGMDIGSSLRDGHSSTGTRGVGLGAIRRCSDEFDAASWPDMGTAIVARIHGSPPTNKHRNGVIQLAHPSEEACGDTFGIVECADQTLLFVADGLGHGVMAAQAVAPLRTIFRRECSRPLPVLFDLAHEALHASRGAAVAVARLDPQQELLTFMGVGNVSCDVIDLDGRASTLR